MFNSELGLEYFLLGVVIFLALMAAVGAWRRPKALTREDAEDLFSHAHERSCGETQRIHDLVQENSRTNSAELGNLRAELARTSQELATIRAELESKTEDLLARVNGALADVHGVVSRAADQQHESIQRNLGDLSSNVSAALSEARKSQDAGIEKVETSLHQVREQVDRASTEMRTSIMELARQQNEAKAHSAIQLCEALISSLGTLRNTIAAQIADQRPFDFLPDQIASGNAESGGEVRPENAPDGPDDPAQSDAEREVHPS